jgi:hypothetical protein
MTRNPHFSYARDAFDLMPPRRVDLGSVAFLVPLSSPSTIDLRPPGEPGTVGGKFRDAKGAVPDGV